MDNSEKNWLSRHLKIIIVVVIIMVLVILAFFALRGRTTVTGAYPASTRTSSIVCEKTGINYPYTEPIEDSSSNEKDESSKETIDSSKDSTEITKEKTADNPSNNIRVIGIFNESKHIERISLDYTMFFADKSAAISGEAFSHGYFGKRLASDGLDFLEFNNHFDIVDEKVILSLNATMDDINDKNYKYLLFDSNPKSSSVKLPLSSFENNFKQKGYKCVSTGDK